ncbi:MAG: hypothetical protein FJ267_08615, partial [Planctomycetes bacterium]|nr:hypothetical protein [Planctomycetota bacterium]
MRRLRIWGAAVLWSLMAWVSLPTAFGQQSTVVLSIKSLDELLDDADVIAEVVGQPGIKDQVEMFINAFTSGNGLQGIDRTSGFGVYWNTSEENPLQMPVVFLPVSDSNALQELLKPLVEDFEDTDGSWSMSFNGTKLFAQIKGGYAFVSITPDVLEDLPNAKRLVNAKQDISLAVSIAGIPQPFKDTFLNQTEEQGRAQLENGPPPEGELEKKARDLGFDWTLAVFKSLVNEGDRFTLGWNLDSESRKVTLESSLTGKS